MSSCYSLASRHARHRPAEREDATDNYDIELHLNTGHKSYGDDLRPLKKLGWQAQLKPGLCRMTQKDKNNI